ncbi:hypothetical protein HORIV_69590 [Vreelandella olivaria]|uniref:Uncharacterized protein n=1 Tax=Vreelandella olivaria TaxID=390919 RepID=A0ABM7GUW2_9GAMM|nr:hypothetical protein HORIV_69590 [Halomonas olivaria]
MPALSAASEQASVVGVSSGGYMAAQLAVAWPERFSGLGVLAAGPWSCAQGSLSLALNQCMMTRRGMPSLDELEARRQRYLGLEQVGSSEALSQLRAYLWHGEEDEVVEPKLGDLLAEQWQQWLASPDQLRVARSEKAGHGWPIQLPSEAAPGPHEWGDCRQGGGAFCCPAMRILPEKCWIGSIPNEQPRALVSKRQGKVVNWSRLISQSLR